jgi:hypothetical protein
MGLQWPAALGEEDMKQKYIPEIEMSKCNSINV